ncbi:MAG: nitronate monooxygenase [Candidatus Omnitrophica bacterium]|nr:nitronate monooxygenase [Candidatus Omnitrophota bacterium]
MKDSHLPDLKIGDMVLNPPIIQGGMGVAMSTSSLVAAVSNCGALGVLASVGLGEFYREILSQYDSHREREKAALAMEIRQIKKLLKRPFAVNIMCVLSNYDDLVGVCVENKVDAIISGAGLPLKLPFLTKGTNIKLIVHLSSAKAAQVICSHWEKKYNRLPDAIIVEGPRSGGHLAFTKGDIASKDDVLSNLLRDVKEFLSEQKLKIPVIAAGGIIDGYDVAKFLKLGASGVQMGARFLCTNECAVPKAVKQLIIDSGPNDVALVESPVGLTARVLKNKLAKRILNGETIDYTCNYLCLKKCYADKAKFCIADVLVKAAKGDIENGLFLCNQDIGRITKIISVKELLDDIAREALSV